MKEFFRFKYSSKTSHNMTKNRMVVVITTTNSYNENYEEKNGSYLKFNTFGCDNRI